MKHLYGKISLQAFFSLLIFISSFGYVRAKENDNKNAQPLHKTQTSNYYAPMLINNIFNYYGNNGDGSFNKFSTSNEGFEFPKGSNDGTTVFEDGLVWTAFQNDTLKCGGSTYNHGLQAGRILTNGTATSLPAADDPAKTEYRIYRVRPDIKPTANADSVTLEEHQLNTDEVSYTGRFQSITADQLRQQYWDDWNEWPADEGAPFTDVNHDGVYEPAVDVPGFPGADQTEWMVMNDLNPTLTVNLYGSTPIGLEVQRTIWAYNTSGALGNTIFIQYKLINKSGVQLDSMYVAQWADPDLGFAGDDFAGCDTVLDLGYCYNGVASDANYANLNLPPPAVGFDLLQGPIVPSVSTDSARFGGTRIHGYKNLPMTAFSYVFKSGIVDGDPPFYISSQYGAQWWYNYMRGLHGSTGEQWINPATGLATPYVFSGDPVVGTGWNDGTGVYPADRRLSPCSGPFTMAPGDTQEVIVAALAAQGNDRLSSVMLLKSYSRIVQKIFDGFFHDLPPGITTSVEALDGNALLHTSVNAVNISASSIAVTFKKYDGTTIATSSLYDDGSHGDKLAGDHIFSGSLMVPQQPEGLYTDIFVHYMNGDTATWSHVVDNITTAQPLKIPLLHIVSDNLNQDGIANPGEDVRYIFSVMNSSAVSLSDLSITQVGHVLAWKETQKVIEISSLTPASQSGLTYDPTNPSTYFSFSLSPDFNELSHTEILEIKDAHNNIWFDTLMFPVQPLLYPPVSGTTRHVSGNTDGNFDVTVVAAPKTTGHTYFILWVDSINANGDPGYSVMDSSTSRMILVNHPLPDVLGHTSPEIDGFRVLFGSIDTLSGFLNWFGNTNNWMRSDSDTLFLDAYSRTIGIAFDHWYSRSTVTPRMLNDIEIDFASTDTSGNVLNITDSNVSYAYRYLRNASDPPAQPSFAQFIVNHGQGFAYQDYKLTMPLAAYEIVGSQRRRLAVGFLENNVLHGLVDGKYWPPYYIGNNNADTTGPMEWFFIFDENYSVVPDAAFEGDLRSTTLPMVIYGIPARGGWWAQGYLRFNFRHHPTNEDVWAFTPSKDVVLPPVTLNLFQNYPNPFNSSTTIQYGIPMRGKVTVKIYDILGREVRTLVNAEQPGGVYKAAWNMQTDEGITVSSGVYFYRVMFSGDDPARTSYVSVKKMLVLK